MQVPRRSLRSLLLVGVLLLAGIVGSGPAGAVGTPVGLGTADAYAVLAGTTVTNTGPTVVTGDLGVHPGAAVTGFPPGLVNGTIHAADAPALQAKADLVTAYDDAAARITTGAIAADLGGQTLVSGVYTGGAVGLTGALTLDGQGDPAAVFVFQAASTLITAPASSVVLVGGAQACNVFWQVTSSATLGTASSFSGTVLALTAITVGTGATVSGRLLARNAAVTLDADTITRPTCAAAVVPVVPAAPATTTTSTTARPTTTTTAARPTTTTSSTTTAPITAPTTTPATPGLVTGTGSGLPASGIIGTLVPNVAATSSVPATPAGPGGTLPRTGSTVGALALGGAVAVVIGAGLLRFSRRPVYQPLHRRQGEA